MKNTMVTTALTLPSYEVVRNLGVVRDITVSSRSIVGNFFGGLQTLFGRNITTIYTNLCEQARSETYRPCALEISRPASKALARVTKQDCLTTMTDWERYLGLTLLGPLLWLQGKYVRRVTPQLSEPPGAREGTTGQGPLLRLLIAGDSAAAGVGAASQDEALSGRLLGYLRPHCTVKWRLVAVNGLDSPGLVKLLEETPVESFDVVVLSIGVNDVTKLRSPSQWLQWQDQLANVIQSRFEPQLLIHSAIPPMHGFTALPQPLRWFMGHWAIEMNRRLEATLSGKTGRILHWPFREAASDGLAADGFHPGPIGYVKWAEDLSKVILLYSGSKLRLNQ